MMYSVTPPYWSCPYVELSTQPWIHFKWANLSVSRWQHSITKHTTHVADETTINKIERLASRSGGVTLISLRETFPREYYLWNKFSDSFQSAHHSPLMVEIYTLKSVRKIDGCQSCTHVSFFVKSKWLSPSIICYGPVDFLMFRSRPGKYWEFITRSVWGCPGAEWHGHRVISDTGGKC